MSDLFTEKAAEWDGRPLVQQLSSAISAAIISELDLKPSLQVMDFGAGTGLICCQLAPLVGSITAIDISPAMLEKLSEKAEFHGQVSTLCQNIIDTPLDRTFDLIVSAMAVHHVESTRTLIQRFSSNLVTGGHVALADLDAEDGSFHPEGIEGVFHDGFERKALKSLLEAEGFVDVRFRTAITVEKDDKHYPIFLVVATKG